MTDHPNNGGTRRRIPARAAAWAAAGFLLLLPLVAGAPWTASDFVFAAVLLFVPLGIFELVARKTADAAYRTAAGMALLAAMLIFWISGAVGITDSEADLMYFLAIAIGIVGAFIARFRPRGMSRAMLVTAVALVAAGMIALVAGMVPAYNSALEILGITGFFAVLFVVSAMLFRIAVPGQADPGAA